MFEDKKKAFLQYIQYMILASNSIISYVPEDELEDNIGILSEMESTKTQLERAKTEEELDSIINP